MFQMNAVALRAERFINWKRIGDELGEVPHRDGLAVADRRHVRGAGAARDAARRNTREGVRVRADAGAQGRRAAARRSARGRGLVAGRARALHGRLAAERRISAPTALDLPPCSPASRSSRPTSASSWLRLMRRMATGHLGRRHESRPFRRCCASRTATRPASSSSSSGSSAS